MKLVAIAGPYRAPNEFEVVQNIRRAEALAVRVWRAGAACICPHKNTALFGGAAPDSVWLGGALEMVQSLERLNSEAMQVMDAMMSLLVQRSRKRIDSLLPAVLKYTADVTRPIFEKIDTISFTYHARLLKVGEDYASRLLRGRYKDDDATKIAVSLTRGYGDHGFVIDGDEAAAIGLDLERIPDNLREPAGHSLPSYTKSTVLGFLEDATDAAKTKGPPAADNAAPGGAAGKPPRRNGGQRRARNRIGTNGPP